MRKRGNAMTAEYAVSTSTEVEVWREPHLHLVDRPLGRHALLLDGFEPLDEASSPFENVRTALEARVIDQPEAITAIVNALDRSEVRLPSDKRPIANLAFLGPTGVGKSEAAKTLAHILGNNGGNLIKIDCSDFSHGHEVASLTGAPVGYTGSDQAPILNKEAVEKKGTVILFDEVEKGSTKLYNLMLQIMGDGELQLKNGSVASFRETIIILTSNLGAKAMSDKLSDTPFGLGTAHKQHSGKSDLEATATKSFKKFFAPEFTNRLNQLVVFHSLDSTSLRNILDIKLAQANDEYEKQLGIQLSLSDATKDHLVETALQEQHNGARPLERAFQGSVQTIFGRYVGSGHIQEGTHMRVFHVSELSPAQRRAHPHSTSLIFAAKKDETLKKTASQRHETQASLQASPEDMLSDIPDEYRDE